ncbi:hypothetical protein KKC08_02795 [Patescibacteria group bacterium]|nr:hypothetical protein [Patescibacteria group bacterium]
MNRILTEGFGAFAGAFFAFLFLRLAEFLTKLYQREVKHYNSLVHLETQLNEIIGIIHDNLYILPNFIRVIKSGNIYFNNLQTIPIDKSHYDNLYNLELMNTLFSYQYQTRKLNDDIATATLGYTDIKNALIQKNLEKPDYIINAELMAKNLKHIEVFLAELQNETIDLLAKIRIQIAYDKPLGTKLQSFFIRSSSKKIKKKEIEKEKSKLLNEIK